MGKNQAYKAMQRSRLGSSSAGPEEVEDGMNGMLLVWQVSKHPIRLLGRSTKRSKSDSPLPTNNKKRFGHFLFQLVCSFKHVLRDLQAIPFPELALIARHVFEEEMRKGELEADKDKMMREYRAQLDAERARKLAQGRNYSSSKSTRKKDKKEKDSRKHSNKKRKRSRKSSDSSSSSSISETSSSDDEERESRRSKSKRRKGKKHLSKSKRAKSDNEEHDGPLPLSRFFGKT